MTYKFTGKLKEPYIDRETGRLTLIFALYEDFSDAYDNLADCDRLELKIGKYRAKRSLEANNYHWLLCSKISEALGQSTAWVHNMALRKCRYVEMLDDRAIYVEIPDTDEAEAAALEADTFHLARTGSVRADKDGNVYRTYVMLRGSHTYDTKEMAHLIDLVVEWAKELGIDTITENEKREMMERYGKKHNGH